MSVEPRRLLGCGHSDVSGEVCVGGPGWGGCLSSASLGGQAGVWLPITPFCPPTTCPVSPPWPVGVLYRLSLHNEASRLGERHTDSVWEKDRDKGS